MKNLLLLLSLTLLPLYQRAFAQILPQPRIFSYADIRNEMGQLRKATVEHISVSGDHTPEGDWRMIQELDSFLQSRITSTDGKHAWSQYSKTVQHLTIRNATWAQLPEQLGRFKHLSEIIFVNCPTLTLQAINDQIKPLPDGSQLGRKFRQEMISMTFREVIWPSATKIQLDSNLFGDLRELRFIHMPNFQDCCSRLLPELQRCCPYLGWLTLEDCLLDNSLPLDTLRGFSRLQALSLKQNRLTRVPALPARLKSLDISSNLISEFYDKQPDNPLRMLYMDCNLFSQLTMTDILARALFPKLEVMSFECNNLNGKELESTVRLLDRGRLASFMSYAPRYVNNFTPEPVSCAPCLEYRWQVIKSLVEPLPLLSGQHSGWKMEFSGDGEKFLLRHPDGTATTYELLTLKTCARGAAQEWVITLEVKEAAKPGAAVQTLEINSGSSPSAGPQFHLR